MSFPSHHACPLAAVMLAALTLAACQQRAQPAEDREMDWARAALERNPAIEVVSTDDEARRFTVRIRASGELATVALGTIVAGPPESFVMQAPPPEPEAPPPAEETAEATARAGIAMAGAPAGGLQPAEPAEEPAETTLDAPAYTVERSAGGVKVTGPGVSIESVGPSREAVAAAAAGTMRADSPIICEGPQLLRLDGRDLTVIGDAIVARDGCEIHLTNSRVDGSRSGIVVRDAKVHVSNSAVRGAFRSLEIGDGGGVYARSSAFTGLVQRQGSGKLEDLGGNRFD